MEAGLKLVILGDARVGKTSLLIKYVQNEFSQRQESTIQASYLQKSVSVAGVSHLLNIWDTVGQERYRALVPVYYQSAKGALVVYDITDKDSFKNVDHWINELRKFGESRVVIAIVGNKTDLERSRKVSLEEAKAYAQSVGVLHMQASAKTGYGLDSTFELVVKQIVATQPVEQVRDRARSHKKIVLERSNVEQKKTKKSCC